MFAKDTKFGASQSGEIRFEILNLTNTAKFGNESTNNAIDTSSFETNAWQRSAMALRTFLAALPPPDLVGVYAYPFGPWLAPTRDRAAIRRALDGVTGTYQPMRTHFHLEPSEVIDINAEMARIGSPATAVRRIGQVALDPGTDAPTVRSVQDRECPSDPNCSARILLDASAAAQDLEASLTQRIDGLRSSMSPWNGVISVCLPCRAPPVVAWKSTVAVRLLIAA